MGFYHANTPPPLIRMSASSIGHRSTAFLVGVSATGVGVPACAFDGKLHFDRDIPEREHLPQGLHAASNLRSLLPGLVTNGLRSPQPNLLPRFLQSLVLSLHPSPNRNAGEYTSIALPC